MEELQDKVKKYMLLGILATVFCMPPAGVAAVFAARALFRVFRKPTLSEKIAGFFDKSDKGGRGE